MLRTLALALLLANAGYFAWSQGLLAAYGFKPARQAEPERLARQIRPDALQLLTPAAPARLAVPAAPAQPAGTACLQAGLFTERQARLLRPRLQAGLPRGSWSLDSSGESSRWIIYMGRYISQDAMSRKRLKLEQLGLAFQPPASPLLNPGLSLGSFASRTEAQDALDAMGQRGLRSARIVLERPELPGLWLRLPAADAAMQARLEALKPLLAGNAVLACP